MLAAARARLPASRRAAAALRQRPVARRYKSDNPQVPAQYDKELADDQPLYDNFSQNAIFTLDVFRRFIKFSAIGFAALGLIGFTAYEGVHQYVELSCLAKEDDPEVKKWGWDRDGADEWKWTGGDDGGTDSKLGLRGTHAVRSAWMAYNWGIGSSTATAVASSTGPGLSVVEARLEIAHEFLSVALAYASRYKDRIHPDTLNTLLARHAGILERMGSRDALFQSRKEYEMLWDSAGGSGIDAARIALKLGDLNKRLGDTEDAQSWWSRALQLTTSTELADTTTLPTSPYAQRTLAQTLVSLSAFYATTGQLQPAATLEDTAISTLTRLTAATFPFLTPPPVPPAPHAAQALHVLFLLHRSALLTIHRAEVSYALRASPNSWCISELERAARASEGVVLTLTGLPSEHDAPVPEDKRGLEKAWAVSQSMRRPAGSLLRDARRSAAEAWNLAGVLYEGQGSGERPVKKAKGWFGGNGKEAGVSEEKVRDAEKALECYERALGWVGVKADRVGNIAEPGNATLDAEWRVLWGNYVRAREVVMKAQTPKRE